MRSLIAIASVVIVVAVLPSCGSNSPTNPSHLISVRLIGASTIAPGASAQFSLLAVFSPNSTTDVSTTAQWHSSDTSILTVSPAGLASAIRSGDVTVSATYGGFPSSLAVVVVPAGTFRLSGEVAGFAVALGGASVQVTAGVGTGLSTSTDSSGLYRLYGVAGPIQVTVSKDAYVTDTRAVNVTGNSNYLDFDLAPVNAPRSVAGSYTFIITADPACASTGTGALPDIARSRQYMATITETEGQLQVTLSGGQLVPYMNGFFGTLAADGGITFDVTGYYYNTPAVAEVLAGTGQVYVLQGLITATRSSNDIVGAFKGTILVRTGTNPTGGTIVGVCNSAHHSVTLTNLSSSPARVRIRRSSPARVRIRR